MSCYALGANDGSFSCILPAQTVPEATWAGWAMFGLVTAFLLAYWAYTLGGIRSLGPLLRERSYMPGFAALSILLALLSYTADDPSPQPALAAAGTVLMVLYALRRQWAWPSKTRPYARGHEPHQPPDDAPVAVLEDGSAVPLAFLARDRVARVHGTLLVHCSLAGSLAAFDDPGPTAAVLPLESGFEIRSGNRYWDGIDGRALDGGASLTPQPVVIMCHATWQAQHPGRGLFKGRGALPALRERTPLLPAARGVEDPMRPGEVVDGQWTPVVSETDSAPEARARTYLARWAAHQRGLVA